MTAPSRMPSTTSIPRVTSAKIEVLVVEAGRVHEVDVDLRVAGVAAARGGPDRAPKLRRPPRLVAHVAAVADEFVGPRAAALDQEIRDDAVEGEAVVVALGDERREPRARERREVCQQLHLEPPAALHRHAHGGSRQPVEVRVGERFALRRARPRRGRDAAARPRANRLRRLRRDARVGVCEIRHERRCLVGRSEFLQPLQHGHARVARRVGVERGQPRQRREQRGNGGPAVRGARQRPRRAHHQLETGPGQRVDVDRIRLVPGRA